MSPRRPARSRSDLRGRDRAHCGHQVAPCRGSWPGCLQPSSHGSNMALAAAEEGTPSKRNDEPRSSSPRAPQNSSRWILVHAQPVRAVPKTLQGRRCIDSQATPPSNRRAPPRHQDLVLIALPRGIAVESTKLLHAGRVVRRGRTAAATCSGSDMAIAAEKTLDPTVAHRALPHSHTPSVQRDNPALVFCQKHAMQLLEELRLRRGARIPNCTNSNNQACRDSEAKKGERHSP